MHPTSEDFLTFTTRLEAESNRRGKSGYTVLTTWDIVAWFPTLRSAMPYDQQVFVEALIKPLMDKKLNCMVKDFVHTGYAVSEWFIEIAEDMAPDRIYHLRVQKDFLSKMIQDLRGSTSAQIDLLVEPK